MKNLFTLITVTFLSLSSFAGTPNDGVDPTKSAFKKWTKNFIAYPEASFIQNNEGVVLVSFEISMEGKMKNIQVDSGVSPELDEKAIEMIGLMPKAHLYENGFMEGTRFVLPVKFKIQ